MLRVRLSALLVLVVLVAACGSSGPSSNLKTAPPSAPDVASIEPASSEPTGESASPDESQPVVSEAPSDPESSAPSLEPSTEPDASIGAGAADGCTGSQANRDFFVSVALAVDWPVLCGALPKGWFISTGSYRLANGGKLLVSYKGPAGATLALSEGAFCSDSGGCVPSGIDVDDAAMGPLSGTFIALDDGGFAIAVDRGAALSWLLEAHGIDEATTRALAAALYEVAG